MCGQQAGHAVNITNGTGEIAKLAINLEEMKLFFLAMPFLAFDELASIPIIEACRALLGLLASHPASVVPWARHYRPHTGGAALGGICQRSDGTRRGIGRRAQQVNNRGAALPPVGGPLLEI